MQRKKGKQVRQDKKKREKTRTRENESDRARAQKTMKLSLWNPASLLLASAPFLVSRVHGDIVISEVSSDGTFNACGGDDVTKGEDYIEIYNTATDGEGVNITGYQLFDSSGVFDNDKFTFPPTTPFLMPSTTMLLCKDFINSFKFSIGSTDAVNLRDANGNLISRAGPLPGYGDEFNTYQYNMLTGLYEYAFPTPDAPNQFQGLQLYINEVSTTKDISVDDSNVCAKSGSLYIELNNLSANEVSLEGYTIEHTNGSDNSKDTVVLPAGLLIGAFNIDLLCGNGVHFDFDIAAGDTITLLGPSGDVISTTGPLSGTNSKIPDGTVTTYNLKVLNDGSMEYLPSLPTPKATNIFPSAMYKQVVINEVANDGTYNVCDGTDLEAGEDYIELYNPGTEAVDLTGWVLHDDNGRFSSEAFTFSAAVSSTSTTEVTTAAISPSPIIGPGEYKLLCGDFTDSFQFGIGSSDTITLLDAEGLLVSTTGKAKGLGSESNTFQLDPSTGTYGYSFPTPGEKNIFLGQPQVLISEVSQTGIAGTCVFPADAAEGAVGVPYVELYNYGGNPADISGCILKNAAGETYTFPEGTLLLPLRYRVFCLGDDTGSASKLAVSETDSLSFLSPESEVITSMTRNLIQGQNTVGSTFQLRGRLTAIDIASLFDLSAQNEDDYTYLYNTPPSPEEENTFLSAKYGGVLFINEVSSSGTYNACGGSILSKLGDGNSISVGDDFIELYNSGTETIDLTGKV